MANIADARKITIEKAIQKKAINQCTKAIKITDQKDKDHQSMFCKVGRAITIWKAIEKIAKFENHQSVSV